MDGARCRGGRVPAPDTRSHPSLPAPPRQEKGRRAGAAGLAGPTGVSPSPCAWARQHGHCWALGGVVPSLLLSSPSDAAWGRQAPHEQEGLVPTDAQARGWHHWPRACLAPALAGGFPWVPNAVAPRVGNGAVLWVLRWAGGVPDPWGGGWGVCARLGTAPMPGAETGAGDIALGYRGMGRGMQWDVISPMESPPAGVRLAGTTWHSTSFTLTSYRKIEPFFIEK